MTMNWNQMTKQITGIHYKCVDWLDRALDVAMAVKYTYWKQESRTGTSHNYKLLVWTC